jgi:hypothetical protein
MKLRSMGTIGVIGVSAAAAVAIPSFASASSIGPINAPTLHVISFDADSCEPIAQSSGITVRWTPAPRCGPADSSRAHNSRGDEPETPLSGAPGVEPATEPPAHGRGASDADRQPVNGGAAPEQDGKPGSTDDGLSTEATTSAPGTSPSVTSPSSTEQSAGAASPDQIDPQP